MIDPALGSGEQPTMATNTPYDPVQDLQPNVESTYTRDATYTSPAPAVTSAGSRSMFRTLFSLRPGASC